MLADQRHEMHWPQIFFCIFMAGMMCNPDQPLLFGTMRCLPGKELDYVTWINLFAEAGLKRGRSKPTLTWIGAFHTSGVHEGDQLSR